ncbi:MAG: hypothetical protein K0A90_03625 [Methanosarcinaceae archaeon]|nr:hypothetical protein [Methanosarcinaceae archaeon]
MSDIPWDKKKDFDKESSEGIPSSDVLNDGLVKNPIEEITHVHKIDLKKPSEIPVINSLSKNIQENEADDGGADIPLSDDIFGPEKIDSYKGDISKPSPRPLFEPKTSPAFEIYGQEPEETNQSGNDSDVSSFPPTTESGASPFPPTPDSGASPFFLTPDSYPQLFIKSSSPDGVPKKMMDGIARSFKTMFKSLMRGGSLIDRMEELREEVEVAEEVRLRDEEASKSIIKTPRFDTVPEIIGLPGMGHTMPFSKQEMEVLKVKEPESEEVLLEQFDEFNKKDILALIEKPIEGVSDKPIEPETLAEIPARAKDVDDLRDEIAGSKSLLDEIVNDIKDISNAVKSSNESIKEINKNADDFNSDVTIGFDSAKEKISSIENRMDGFENTLTLIQSDNTELKKGLSNIEQNISELVSSYGALLSQMYETTQSNDARFEDTYAKVDRINIIESKTSQIENNQVIAAKRITEFENIASVLMEDIAQAHEANKFLKDETKSENAALLEEMALVTEYVEKGLKKAGAESYKSFGEDVHLARIEKNSSTMKLCMEWLEFLMELVGRNNLPDILSYYEELGWISDDVRLEFMQYVEGINYYAEKPDWKLNPDEHVKSIWFIEKLAGVKVDKNKLSIIERDIEWVKKGTEIYGI